MSEIPVRHVKQYAEGDAGGISYVETDWDEGKWIHGEASLEVDPEECALALVDFWDTCWREEPIIPEYGRIAELNQGATFQDRSKQITLGKAVPVLERARASGMTVVHLPSTGIAVKYPQCRRLQQEVEEDKFFLQMFAERVSVTITERFCKLIVSRRDKQPQEFTAIEGPAYVEENKAFIKALREDRPPPIDHRDGLMATLMVLQAMASAKSGRPEPIKSVLSSQQTEQRTISCQ